MYREREYPRSITTEERPAIRRKGIIQAERKKERRSLCEKLSKGIPVATTRGKGRGEGIG